MDKINEFQIIGNSIIITYNNGEQDSLSLSIENIERLNKLYYLENKKLLEEKEKIVNEYNKSCKTEKTLVIAFGISMGLLIISGAGILLSAATILSSFFKGMAFISLLSTLICIPAGSIHDSIAEYKRIRIKHLTTVEENLDKLENYRIKEEETKARICNEPVVSLEKAMDEKISNIDNGITKEERFKKYVKKVNEQGY
jgi:hypothetical protein